MKKTYSIYFLLAGYLALLLGFAPINLLSFDTYYYWEWSRHLDLSYYDGSPMIAYFIRLATLLFGDTLFALSLIGILVTTFTAVVIYKTAQLFLSTQACWIATLSWLFSPLITMDLLTQTTYDTPLMLFWALTLYYTVKFIQTNQTKVLYYIGLNAGLMMLSKYTGIVLILSLLIFLVSSSYRSIFKSKHFYFAMLLAIFIFSPVLIWNYQHQWQSFIYQLTTHQLNEISSPLHNSFNALINMFIPTLNFMLILPFITSKNKLNKKNELCLTLCRIVCITFLCFYLYTATKAELRIFWLAPYLVSAALLLGYSFDVFPYRKPIIALIALYALISIGVFIDNSSKYHFLLSKRLINYQLMQQFNKDYPQQPAAVLTSGWFEARMLFFLKNKPAVYTIDCGEAQNQYALWSAEMQKKISDKSLKDVLYIDARDKSSCLNKYFDQCRRVPTSVYAYKNKERSLYVYQCTNA